ncbi:MAG: FtsX-like permease family protein, partial [Novosphingobium sp.]
MSAASTALPWSAAWRIARRDLSARFKGLRLLLVCLFLGVGALAAIGTLTGAIEYELASRGRVILGGDIQLSVWQREATADELAAFAKLGKVSGGKRLQAMAIAGDSAAPVELKSVDAAWPLYGQLTLKDGRKVSTPPVGGAWLGEGAAARLGIKVGDSFTIGSARLKLAGIVGAEPDRLGEGFTLGPVAIVRADVPAAAGLLLPGAMYRSKYRIAFTAPHDPESVSKTLAKQFPASGFDVRTRDNAAPGAERFISRLGEFLVLVGLAALAIAGIGIGGGVSSWLEARRGSIATLKVLGATSGDIARITLLQIMAAAVVGTVAGLTAGVMISPLLAQALAGLLPVEGSFRIDPAALARAAAYGLLVALVFTAPPLARARTFPAMALLRARVSPLGNAARHAALPVGLGLAAIAALALLSAAQPLVTAGFLGGAAAMLGLLAGLGWLLRRGFARLPRPANPLLRAALANLHRPGAQTGALVTALGFGLTTFVLLAAVESSLDANIASRVPARAPDYFIMDVPKDRLAEFDQAVHTAAPQAHLRTVPALRGAILAYGPTAAMIRTSDLKVIPENAWPLRGERGLTYADELPEGNSLTAGKWWPKAYAGPPLVSIDEKLAEALDLHLGDRLTIGLLGVERSATIASFRRIDWDSMGFNYVLVFSPNAIADAPHNLAATIDLPPGAAKGDLLRRLTRAFPSSSVIETGPLLRDARNLLGQMSLAILAAASVAVLAGIAVLLGAIAAARASRSYDTVILRVLGASRRQLLLMQIG